MGAKKQTYEGGATRSELQERYDLIPSAAMRAMARRLALGAERHGARNWEQGGEEFVQATKNHLIKHLFLYLEGDKSDAHLDAIICNAAFLCHFRDKEEAGCSGNSSLPHP